MYNKNIKKVTCLKLIPLSENAVKLIPEYATQESACFDIKADILDRDIPVHNKSNFKTKCKGNPFVIEPGHRALIPTGFIFVIPHGYSMRLHPRSGHSWKNGVCLMNGEGIIDSDYPNETFIMLHNTSNKPFLVKHGDRIAQAELVKTRLASFDMLSIGSTFENATDRDGGFGSTD